MLRFSYFLALASLSFGACADNSALDARKETVAPSGGGDAPAPGGPAPGPGTSNEGDTNGAAPTEVPDDAGLNPPSMSEPFRLQSPALKDGGAYPDKYSCNGDDVLPAISWGEPPVGTKSFVLTFTDLDADLNDGRFVHWVLFGIGADVRSLPEDIGTAANPPVPPGSTQVRAWSSLCGALGGSQFLGPCPSEQHDYQFKLYALSVAMLEGADCNLQPIQIDDLVTQSGAVLGETTLTSTYVPPP